MKKYILTQFGNPVLRKEAKRLLLDTVHTSAFRQLVKDMFFTMHKEQGIGLAAPQIGKSLRLAVLGVRPTKFRPTLHPVAPAVMVNPKILHASREVEDDWEGCLSFPDGRGVVPRSTSIAVEYWDENGEHVQKTVTGFAARVFQHEIDHLHGILYVDRMRNMRTLCTLAEYEKRVLRFR